MDWDAKVEPVAFDAKRAMGYLEAICNIGPRISGTEGMKKQQELIEKHFKDLGGQGHVSEVHRPAAQPAPEAVEMANLIVSWHPDAQAARHPLLALRHPAHRRPGARPARLAQAVRQRQRRRLRRRPADGAGPPHEGPEDATSASISSSSTARNTSSTTQRRILLRLEALRRRVPQDAQANRSRLPGSDFTTWPIATTTFNSTDFSSGVDVSWYKNHYNSNSMFAWNYQDDFFAGYDHGRNVGTMSIADHHAVPGKKFWTWGNNPYGRSQDTLLTDNDGPYIELMVGAIRTTNPTIAGCNPMKRASGRNIGTPSTISMALKKRIPRQPLTLK